MTDRELITELLRLVNVSNTLPAQAMLDYLAPEAPSASVQQLPGARWAERYIDGSGTREQPFAVLLRVDGSDSASRMDASAALMALGDALDAAITPAGIRVSIEGTPSMVERNDDRSEVWRVGGMLESDRSA